MIPTRLRDRARHARRMVGAAAKAGVKRLVRSDGDDDRAFGEALVAELDQLKGMAMKVGQILSYMDGALPEQTQAALASLQRGVEPVEFEVVADVVERSLGAPLGQLFDRFDRAPIASASIGQVHRASFGGREVAVKVQYPGVRATFEADLKQLRRIAGIASLATRVDGQAIVDDLRDRLIEECDYRAEARWMARFAEAFADRSDVVIPEVIQERSSDVVLTSAWCEGRTLEQLVAEASAAERNRAGLTLATFAWRSLWVHSTINADPHPGNQLFRRDQVVMLDFGCVRSFRRSWLDAERRTLRAVLNGDRPGFRQAVIDSGLAPAPDRFDFDAHWAMISYQWEPYLAPSYRFTREYVLRGQKYSGPGNPNLRKLAIPPEWIWTTRLHWGLHAVLARLGAEGDFRSVLMDALDRGETDAAPLRP
jgi:predicted unusual protein kinase regulating ubiquinone biosynthesis (AarF/ABC1/UbiB family)